VQALAAACGAAVLALRAQALREGDAQAQRFLERTRPLLPRPLSTEPQAEDGRARPDPIPREGGQQCQRPTHPPAATTTTTT
jgi:hypothetical protein